MAQRNRTACLKPGKSRQTLTITHPNAAGIDIGSASHFVAVPPDRDEQPVREFASFTTDLNALADWLAACGVDTVAMESTGVYWIPLFELLESRGFTVLLVNARHVKNVSGRKSDVLDCQWLQQLMSYGLLRGAFRPADNVCVLRALYRQRGTLLRSQARHVQHMQKALVQMNIQLANVLADVVGETGQKILRAIVAGEHDGRVLGAMRNVRVRASADEIAKSLQGNWRAEHLFALKQALDAFDFVGTQLTECDREIELQLHSLQLHDGEPAKGKKRGRARNAPKFDLRTQLFRMCGVDLTRIDGVDVTTALGRGLGNRHRHVAFPDRQALHLLARPVSGHEDHRRQGDERQDQAGRQPRRPGLALGRRGAAQQQIGPRRVLPAPVLAHGQTQGRHGRRAQTRAPDLHDADQGRGVHRPGSGLLRAALSGARAAGAVAAGREARHEDGPGRTVRLRDRLRSETRVEFLKSPLPRPRAFHWTGTEVTSSPSRRTSAGL